MTCPPKISFNEDFELREADTILSLSNVTDVKPLQPEKVYSPMYVTPSGMVTDVKPLQSEKAELPMDVTLSGMVTEVKPLQPEKA